MPKFFHNLHFLTPPLSFEPSDLLPSLVGNAAVCLQVLGDRRHRPVVSARPDLGLRPDVRQREHGGHGLPVYHLQLPAGHVHLHLPLRAAEEGVASRVLKASHLLWRSG